MHLLNTENLNQISGGSQYITDEYKHTSAFLSAVLVGIGKGATGGGLHGFIGGFAVTYVLRRIYYGIEDFIISHII